MRTLRAVLASSACIVIGLLWDISWHSTIGRDSFWSPPHILEQLGAIVVKRGGRVETAALTANVAASPDSSVS